MNGRKNGEATPSFVYYLLPRRIGSRNVAKLVNQYLSGRCTRDKYNARADNN